ncbi:MAG: GGDEF domain-containing protein [Spirochaetales bacterium]|nr:GGDEF domain-containing protein [Spirochaetales bacterium]
MTEKRDWNFLFKLFLVLSLAIAVLVAVFVSINKSGTPSLTMGSVTEINDGWVVISEKGDMPEFTDFETQLDVKDIVLSRIFIFPYGSSDDTLKFSTNYCAVEVYQDGMLKFSLWSDEEADSGRLLGKTDVFVGLNVIQGEASEVEVHLHSSVPITVGNFYLGKASDILLGSFTEAMPAIIFVTASVVMVIAMLLIAFLGRKKYIISRTYFYFLYFVLACAIWVFTNIKIFTYFGIDAAVLTITSYECFLFIPLPLSIYLYCSFKRFRTIDLVLAWASVLNLIIITILHISKAVSFAESSVSSIIIICLCLIAALVQSVADYEMDKSKSAMSMLVGIVLMGAGAAIQIIRYFKEGGLFLSVFLILGMFLFNFTQMITIISGIFTLVGEGRKAGDYLVMAKTDPLTGLGNRRALDLFIHEISEKDTPFFRLGCIVCDLNDLKKTNDVYGHAIGDQLIKDFAHCLEVCFEDRGIPFRTGGDEFYILFSDVEVDMAAMMRRLVIGIEGSNTNANYRISCSSGCYADYVPSHNEQAIWDIIKFADAEMYKQKRKDRESRAVGGGYEAPDELI